MLIQFESNFQVAKLCNKDSNSIWALNQIYFKTHFYSLFNGMNFEELKDSFFARFFLWCNKFQEINEFLHHFSALDIIFEVYSLKKFFFKMSLLNLVTCVTSQSEDPDINFEGCFEDKSKANNSHFPPFYTQWGQSALCFCLSKFTTY